LAVSRNERSLFIQRDGISALAHAAIERKRTRTTVNRARNNETMSICLCVCTNTQFKCVRGDIERCSLLFAPKKGIIMASKNEYNL